MNSILPHLLAAALAILACSSSVFAQSDDYLTGQVRIAEQNFPYVLLPPKEIVEGQSYPLLLFLHGAGERGDDNQLQKRHFPERMASEESRDRYPCFVLAPQCPPHKAWVEVNWKDKKSTAFSPTPTRPMRAAIAALEEVVRTQPIDLQKISLTGLSMGGYGSWDLAIRHPDWFSAVTAICGGGDETLVSQLAGLPVQAWHGAADKVVPPLRSRTMVKAAQAIDIRIDYHELPGVGHNSWEQAYSEDSCLSLMLAAKRDPTKRQMEAARLLANEISEVEHIAFLGDSITQAGNNPGGYVDLIRQVLHKDRPESIVIPAGISGNKVPDLLARFQKDVVEPKATLVFIYIGINDVWHSKSGRGTDPTVFENGLRTLIRQLRASGAEVVVATPSVIGELPQGKNSLDKMLDQFSAISRQVALEEDVILCDLRQAFFDHLRIFNPTGKTKGVLTKDGVHLTPAGNSFIATEACQALRKAVLLRKERFQNSKLPD